MVNLVFLSFAFSAGLVAFFSPCAIVLLPGYITYYLTEEAGKKERTKIKVALSGVIYGLLTILGFFTVFGIFGALVIIFGNFIKQFIPWITVIVALLLIALGISMLLGKDLLINLPTMKAKAGKERFGSYFFGIAYATAALGCTFPLFLSVMLQGTIAGSVSDSVYSLIVYIGAMSLVLIAITTVSALTKDIMLRKINAIMPYIKKISALIIIAAGIYMIYFQSLLFI